MSPAVAASILSIAIGLCISAGLVMAIEEWRYLRARGALTFAARREMLLSLSLLPPNLLVSLLLGAVWLAIYTAAYERAPLHLDLDPLTFVGAFVAVDFVNYWEHRCAHRVPWLWRLYHSPHHSSGALTVATAYRVSFVNQALSPAFVVPIALMGFPPLLVVGFQLLCFHYQAWLHTETVGSLGWLDRVFNTPANHRIHHSSAVRHRDRNCGAILILWDRCFGTYAAPERNLAYGIAGEAPPVKWWEVYWKPWRG